MRWTRPLLIFLPVLAGTAACSLPCSADGDCPTDLSCRDQRCVAVTGSGSSSGGNGGSSSSGGSTSSSSSSGSSGSPGCDLPWVMALMCDNAGSGNPVGEVRRWSLTGATPTACPTLTMRGTMDRWANAVGWTGRHVLVGSQGHLSAIDPALDNVAWAHTQPPPESGVPAYVFRVRMEGADRVAVAYLLSTGDTLLRALELYDPAGNGEYVRRLSLETGAMDLHGTAAIAAHPRDEGRVIYASTPSIDQTDIPTGSSQPPQTTYINGLPLGGTTHRLSSLVRPGGLGRVVYLQPTKLWMSNDDGNSRSPRGPFTCGLCNPMAAQDAVPDPTHPDRLFAICDTGTADSVVRIDVNGTCDLVLDGATLGSQLFPSRLAIAE